MLVELRVAQLGVIEDVTLVLGPGMTALTGETGAGKTLLVDAIELLTGGAADPRLVRPGAEEALVEGRFSRAGPTGDAPEEELILARVVPAQGRGRCYVNGRMVSVGQLSELGRTLVDLHGQHAHQSLLSPAAQRSGLDQAGVVDTSEVAEWRKAVRDLRDVQAALGGDQRSRARELDLLNYQLAEIDAAAINDPAEDEALQMEEETLADAAGLIIAAQSVWSALGGDEGAVDRVGAAVAATGSRRPLESVRDRLIAVQEELADAAAEARAVAEMVEDDPAHLAQIQERRRVLTELRRKYGGSLAEVIEYREDLRAQVQDLQTHDERAAAVAAELERAEKELAAAYERLWDARRKAAPSFAAAVEVELRRLAMPRARFAVEVGPDPDKEVVGWLLGANPGEPLLPLSKVASGGELARTMLAARLVLGPAGEGPLGNGVGGASRTLVFDEVDAGIGGEAAVAVGTALAALAPRHQVLVVTHLAQVAAFADHQLAVTKEMIGESGGERTIAQVRLVRGEERVVELARMLSGRPDSESARRHAEELLANAIADPPQSRARKRRGGAKTSPTRHTRRG
jgi:DNA repair protein RecN (Recombination protein N)